MSQYCILRMLECSLGKLHLKEKREESGLHAEILEPASPNHQKNIQKAIQKTIQTHCFLP